MSLLRGTNQDVASVYRASSKSDTNAVTITSVFLNENRPSSRLVRVVGGRHGGCPFRGAPQRPMLKYGKRDRKRGESGRLRRVENAQMGTTHEWIHGSIEGLMSSMILG
jgi:hypothetical protein